MAFNDNAVFTASTGYMYLAPVGTAAPTREQLRDFDPETFGTGTYNLKVTGASGNYKVTFDSQESEDIKVDASTAEVQAAIEKISTVGAGNVVVSGESVKKGLHIALIGSLFGTDKELSAAASGGGGSPTVNLTKQDDAQAWSPIGHTSTEDLPEFGYDGGDTEIKGSWQKKKLKEITTDEPVDFVTVKALQFDPETLELYYGKNASSVEGVFGVDNTASGGVERSVLIIIQDGDYKIGFSAAKCSVRRDEAVSLSTDEFSALPLKATFIKHPGRHLFEWIVPAQ